MRDGGLYRDETVRIISCRGRAPRSCAQGLTRPAHSCDSSCDNSDMERRHSGMAPNPKQAYGDKKVPLHRVPPVLLVLLVP
jgi:hypothetical protein